MSDRHDTTDTGEAETRPEELIEVVVRDVDGGLVASASGEIDVHTAPLWEREIRAALSRADSVVLDMAAVTFMDSSGLRALITLHGEATEAGRTLVLGEVSRPVRRVIEVTGLGDHLGLSTLPEG